MFDKIINLLTRGKTAPVNNLVDLTQIPDTRSNDQPTDALSKFEDEKNRP